MDRDLLARAYDRSAQGYDDRFRALQREKYRAAGPLLVAFPTPPGDVLDAGGGKGLFSEWLADPAAEKALAVAGLQAVAGAIEAGQDRAFLLRRG